MEDARHVLMAGAIRSHFQLSAEDKALDGISTDAAVRSFVDDASCVSLVARYNQLEADQGVTFSNELQVASTVSQQNSLVMFKIKPEVVSTESFKTNVLTSTMMASPVNSLYHAVKNMYAPLLLSNDKWSGTFHPQLQELLTELEAGLGKALRQQRGGSAGGEDSLESIITPTDEFQYW